MSSTDMTMEEFSESLTGFEEVAIAKHFGEDWSTLADRKPTMFLRSLVFVDITRGGKDAKAAKNDAMAMSLKVANDYFAEEAEADPEDPITESGKDDSLDASPPDDLPSSAS